MHFTIDHTDMNTNARAGQLSLAHGVVQTPVFMPVGTQGTVKGLTPYQLEELGAEIMLSNTYHLFLRPGIDIISKAGGLNNLIGWQRPILTDSGGYQVYSLSHLRKITDDDVTFQSHIDGTTVTFSPEKVIEIQEAFGVDIMMQLDECPPADADKKQVDTAVLRSILWAKKSLDKMNRKAQSSSALFGIVQGGLYEEFRQKSAEGLSALNMAGYALGGFAVGEETNLTLPVIKQTAEMLPFDKPRYLMGTGFPEDIVRAVGYGIDMFDCILPTRCAQTGLCFYPKGRLRIKKACHKEDLRPIDDTCTCYTCQNFSRAFLRHMFISNEITATILMTLHNIHYYLDLCRQMRQAICQDKFPQFCDTFFTTQKYF